MAARQPPDALGPRADAITRGGDVRQQLLERALHENQRLRKDNERLRAALRQLRPAVITDGHRRQIDRALEKGP